MVLSPRPASANAGVVARKAQNLNFSEPDARSVPGELVLIEAGSGRGFLTRPASVNAGRIGSGGVAFRASTLLPLGCNLLLKHACLGGVQENSADPEGLSSSTSRGQERGEGSSGSGFPFVGGELGL